MSNDNLPVNRNNLNDPDQVLARLLGLLEKYGENPSPYVFASELEEAEYYNGWADFWRYFIGANTITADTKNKKTNVAWSSYQNNPISEEQHRLWKKEKRYSSGLAVMAGKVWHRSDKNGLFLTIIDLDRSISIREFCSMDGKIKSIDEFGKDHLVEQHRDDRNKAHVLLYSPIPFPQKGSDAKIGIEVKSLGTHGIVFCSPSIHKNRNGLDKSEYRYEIIDGLKEPRTLTLQQANKMILHINYICAKHKVDYLAKNKIARLKPMINNLTIDLDLKIFEGERHTTLAQQNLIRKKV